MSDKANPLLMEKNKPTMNTYDDAINRAYRR